MFSVFSTTRASNQLVTAFHMAAQHGEVEDSVNEDGEECLGLRSCLEQLRNVDVLDVYNKGETALIQAAKNDQIEAVHFLLDQGANVEIKSNNQFAAIHYAVDRGYFEVAQMLIEKNPNIVNSKSARDWAPLHFAAARGNLEIAELLVVKGANVSAVALDENGEELTSLAIAVNQEIKNLINSQLTPFAVATVCSATRLDGRDEQEHSH